MNDELDTPERVFREVNERNLGAWLDPQAPGAKRTAEFVLSRFAVGREILGRLERDHLGTVAPGAHVLDLGCGNGGAVLPFALREDLSCWALDLAPHGELAETADALGVTVHFVVGSGERLPFEAERFDVVLCLETIEHVSAPDALAAEITRILRPGGVCVLTTPPRVRYLFRRDPHYGVWGIAPLPNTWQRAIVERVRPPPLRYALNHLYWTAGGLLRHFHELERTEVVAAHPWILPAFLDWKLILARKPLA